MAKIYECDRCGSQGKEEGHTRTVNYPLKANAHYTPLEDYVVRSVDLCKSCIWNLNDFMQPLPRAGN